MKERKENEKGIGLYLKGFESVSGGIFPAERSSRRIQNFNPSSPKVRGKDCCPVDVRASKKGSGKCGITDIIFFQGGPYEIEIPRI